MSVEVRAATADDSLGVRRVLDAAMLEIREDLPARIAAGDVLVAEDAENSNRDVPVLGALVLVPRDRGAVVGDQHVTGGEHENHADSIDAYAMHIDAVAVRRARRGRGTGSALVRAAAERHPRLTAEFDPSVRPFYESIGFEIAPADGEDGRLRGIYEAEG